MSWGPSSCSPAPAHRFSLASLSFSEWFCLQNSVHELSGNVWPQLDLCTPSTSCGARSGGGSQSGGAGTSAEGPWTAHGPAGAGDGIEAAQEVSWQPPLARKPASSPGQVDFLS